MTQQTNPSPPAGQNIVVAIATTGRAEILSDTVRHIALQHRLPDALVVSAAGADDVEPAALEGLPFPVRLVFGPKGLCRQRNLAIESAPEADVLLFLDDDFLMRADYLAALDALFLAHPEIVVATGHVLADGILGPGYSVAEGIARLAADRAGAGAGRRVVDVYNAYGCNMALRLATVRASGERFDTALVLYGWQEDTDMSRRLARHGRVVRDHALLGVHLGTKRGRSPGRRLGYSQVANPVFLVKKGSLDPGFATRQVLRNVLKNLARAPFPEEWVDRRGRLGGNLIAVADLVRGRLHPGRAETF